MKFLRKPVVWALLVVVILAAITTAQSSTIKHQRQDIERYQVNHETLLADITQYRTVNGELVASVQALTLRNDELEHLIPKYTEEIEQLQLKVRDVQSVAHVTTEVNAEVLAPLDTVRTPAPEPEYTDAPTPDIDKPHNFIFEDDYITVKGEVHDGHVKVTVEHRDSLTLIAHRKARKCLFKRKGRIIGYDVKSSSPYTKIKDVEYIELLE